MCRAMLRVAGHGRSARLAKRSGQTFQKQQKEHARQQKQQKKAARRLQAKQRRAQAGTGDAPGETADGRPGPQPAPAWGDRVGGPTYPLPRTASW